MKILLVDDNKYILESLQTGIDYESLGFDEVFVARSLKSAVAILEKEEIHAVLTDIEMPNGSGLELLEWMNENRPGIVTVFCTSYSDFNYAKKALELHSFEYYLKPVDYADLYKLLQRVVEEIRRREKARHQQQYGEYWVDSMKNNKKYYWLEILIRNYGYAEGELEELAIGRHLDYRDTDCFLIAEFRLNLNRFGMPYQDRQFVLDNMVEELLATRGLILEAIIGEKDNNWLLVISEREIMEDNTLRIQEVLGQLEQSLKCTIYFIYEDKVSLQEMRNAYLELEQEAKLHREDTPTQTTCMKYERQTDKEISKECEEALEGLRVYIEQHYNEKLGQEELADHVYYNLAYLSKIFKKKYGMSIGNYILEYRIERAKKMLKTGKRSVTDVSLDVGYDNFAYFSRLFKKKTGLTPMEYRKKKEV